MSKTPKVIAILLCLAIFVTTVMQDAFALRPVAYSRSAPYIPSAHSDSQQHSIANNDILEANEIKRPKVATVILNNNNTGYTKKLIESLEKIERQHFTDEIIIVDNGSEEGQLLELDALAAMSLLDIHIIRLNENLGGSARNFGIKRALDNGSDYVLFLDNDTLVAPDTVDILVQRAEVSLPEEAAFGPVIYLESQPNVVWAAGVRSPSRHIREGYDREIEVDYFPTAAVLVKAAALRAIGGFDERYFLYSEDSDWFRRAKEKGYKSILVPNTRVLHAVGGGFGRGRFNLLRIYHITRSKVLMLRKYNELFKLKELVWLILSIGKSALGSIFIVKDIKGIQMAAKGLYDGLNYEHIERSAKNKVTDIRTMNFRDRTIFVLFSSAWITLVLSMSYSVLCIMMINPHPVIFFILCVLTLKVLLKIFYHWYITFSMKKPLPMEPAENLKVAIAITHVPASEPIEILEKTLIGARAVEYPHDVWVLDEGNDPMVKELCLRLGGEGAGIYHFSRKDKPLYNQPKGDFAAKTKGGNINAWLDAAGYKNYEIITLMDVDHIPEKHFLDNVLGYFKDENVSYVQAPQVYYNQEESFIARGAAEHTYYYYGPRHMGYYGMGMTIIDGCHTTFRADTLKKVGGYPIHPGDDLLLAYKMREKALKGVYVPKVLAKGLTPSNWNHYFKQQYRWAFSTIDLKLHYYPQAQRSFSLLHKIGFFMHGIGYITQATTLLFSTLTIVMLISGCIPYISVALVCQGVSVSALSTAMGLWLQKFNIIPQKEKGMFWRMYILGAARWFVLTRAVIDAFADKKKAWTVTPKFKDNSSHSRLFLPHIALSVLLLSAVTFSFLRGSPQHYLFHAYAIMQTVIYIAIAGTSVNWRQTIKGYVSTQDNIKIPEVTQKADSIPQHDKKAKSASSGISHKTQDILAAELARPQKEYSVSDIAPSELLPTVSLPILYMRKHERAFAAAA